MPYSHELNANRIKSTETERDTDEVSQWGELDDAGVSSSGEERVSDRFFSFLRDVHLEEAREFRRAGYNRQDPEVEQTLVTQLRHELEQARTRICVVHTSVGTPLGSAWLQEQLRQIGGFTDILSVDRMKAWVEHVLSGKSREGLGWNKSNAQSLVRRLESTLQTLMRVVRILREVDDYSTPEKRCEMLTMEFMEIFSSGPGDEKMVIGALEQMLADETGRTEWGALMQARKTAWEEGGRGEIRETIKQEAKKAREKESSEELPREAQQFFGDVARYFEALSGHVKAEWGNVNSSTAPLRLPDVTRDKGTAPSSTSFLQKVGNAVAEGRATVRVLAAELEKFRFRGKGYLSGDFTLMDRVQASFQPERYAAGTVKKREQVVTDSIIRSILWQWQQPAIKIEYACAALLSKIKELKKIDSMFSSDEAGHGGGHEQEDRDIPAIQTGEEDMATRALQWVREGIAQVDTENQRSAKLQVLTQLLDDDIGHARKLVGRLGNTLESINNRLIGLRYSVLKMRPDFSSLQDVGDLLPDIAGELTRCVMVLENALRALDNPGRDFARAGSLVKEALLRATSVNKSISAESARRTGLVLNGHSRGERLARHWAMLAREQHQGNGAPPDAAEVHVLLKKYGLSEGVVSHGDPEGYLFATRLAAEFENARNDELRLPMSPEQYTALEKGLVEYIVKWGQKKVASGATRLVFELSFDAAAFSFKPVQMAFRVVKASIKIPYKVSQVSHHIMPGQDKPYKAIYGMLGKKLKQLGFSVLMSPVPGVLRAGMGGAMTVGGMAYNQYLERRENTFSAIYGRVAEGKKSEQIKMISPSGMLMDSLIDVPLRAGVNVVSQAMKPGGSQLRDIPDNRLVAPEVVLPQQELSGEFEPDYVSDEGLEDVSADAADSRVNDTPVRARRDLSTHGNAGNKRVFSTVMEVSNACGNAPHDKKAAESCLKIINSYLPDNKKIASVEAPSSVNIMLVLEEIDRKHREACEIVQQYGNLSDIYNRKGRTREEQFLDTIIMAVKIYRGNSDASLTPGRTQWIQEYENIMRGPGENAWRLMHIESVISYMRRSFDLQTTREQSGIRLLGALMEKKNDMFYISNDDFIRPLAFKTRKELNNDDTKYYSQFDNYERRDMADDAKSLFRSAVAKLNLSQRELFDESVEDVRVFSLYRDASTFDIPNTHVGAFGVKYGTPREWGVGTLGVPDKVPGSATVIKLKKGKGAIVISNVFLDEHFARISDEEYSKLPPASPDPDHPIRWEVRNELKQVPDDVFSHIRQPARQQMCRVLTGIDEEQMQRAEVWGGDKASYSYGESGQAPALKGKSLREAIFQTALMEKNEVGKYLRTAMHSDSWGEILAYMIVPYYEIVYKSLNDSHYKINQADFALETFSALATTLTALKGFIAMAKGAKIMKTLRSTTKGLALARTLSLELGRLTVQTGKIAGKATIDLINPLPIDASFIKKTALKGARRIISVRKSGGVESPLNKIPKVSESVNAEAMKNISSGRHVDPSLSSSIESTTGAHRKPGKMIYPLGNDGPVSSHLPLKNSDRFIRPFGTDSYIKMRGNNIVIVRAHGAPGNTAHFKAEYVATVIRDFVASKGFKMEHISQIALESCYSGTLKPVSQAQALANNLQKKVIGYSDVFTNSRVGSTDEAVFTPHTNPAARAMSRAGNTAVYYGSETVLSVRKRIKNTRESAIPQSEFKPSNSDGVGLPKPSVKMEYNLATDIPADDYLHELKNTPFIRSKISNPKGQCASLMVPVSQFMKAKEFDNIRFRGMYLWSNAMDLTPMNHFVVVGNKNGIDYVFDVSAHHFQNRGMETLNAPLILSHDDWVKKYESATTRKLIYYSDFRSSGEASHIYHTFPVSLASQSMEGKIIINSPTWYKTFKASQSH